MRYLIWGYYGFENLGDELMLEAIAQRIRRHDAGAVIHVRCLQPPRVAGIVPFPVERMLARQPLLFMGPYLLRVLFRVLRVDVLVIGGGTLFLDKGRHNPSMLILAFVARFARLLGKKVVIIGAGIDDLDLTVNRRYLSWTVASSTAACFRDERSYAFAAGLAPSAPLCRSADIVFDPDVRSRLLAGAPDTRERIILSCSDYFRTWQDPVRRLQLTGRVRSLIESLTDRFGSRYRIALCAFQEQYGEQDREFLEGIRDAVLRDRPAWQDRLELHRPTTDATISGLFGTAACVISMRYHALVLAALFRRPFLGVAVETKISEVCRDFSMPVLSIDAFLERGLDADAVGALLDREVEEATVQRQGALAALNFQWLETL